MDKNKIKSYAVWARRAMIEAVKDRAFKVGIEENKIHDIERLQGGFKVAGREDIFNIPSTHRDTLVKLINEKGYEQVIEEVAYTWFNRFMGLRFMEVNEYLPTGVRIISSEDEGKIEPDVLTNINDIEDELDLNLDYVYDLQDRGTEQAREELYKYILIKQCNELGNIIPQMFEKIQDYTELLLPDNLLQEGSVIRKMVTDIDEEDWKEEVEIIGWMYQYYILEKKELIDKYVGKGIKVKKQDLPAKTQIFTPKWIVKYMVENSIGRIWLEGHPNEELQKKWKYYLEEVEQESKVEEELKKIREEHSHLTPEDIKVLDPCMGSGHILVYAFDVLYQIYKEAGYGEREIPRKILQNNIYGLDIDDRSVQLASFALIMKARGYNRRLFREIEKEALEINLCSIQESNTIGKEVVEYFITDNKHLKDDFEYIVEIFNDSKVYGSILSVKEINIYNIINRVNQLQMDKSLIFKDYRDIILNIVPRLIKQYILLNQKYDVCITNPPYLGRGNLDKNLSKYLESNYTKSKADLFSVLIERGFEFLKPNGINAQVTMQSWMFLSSFESFRKMILEKYQLMSLMHMDNMVMRIAFGTCVAIWRNNYYSINGTYQKIYFSDIGKDDEPIKFPSCDFYIRNSDEFLKVKGYTVNYWISSKIRKIFETCRKIEDITEPRQGIATGDNERFIRTWSEVNINKIGFGYQSYQKFLEGEKMYAPINKGGVYRKWYGNNESVIKFNIENFNILSKQGNKLPSKDFYFKEGMTWGKVTSGKFSSRFVPKGYVFSDAGMKVTTNKNNIGLVGTLLNSKLVNLFLSAISETINYEKGNIARIPIPNINNEQYKVLEEYFQACVRDSKKDWDNFEVSWDFIRHPLVRVNSNLNKLSLIFAEWKEECEEAFRKQKYNEEEVNKILIEFYGLQNEITPDINEKDITLRKADRKRDIRNFISYSVGCMFGRYSIDAEGLIYAGGNFSDKWKVTSNNWQVRKVEKDKEDNVISSSWVDSTFIPTAENIIPITEDEYFEDDIVTRFIKFVEVVYGDETLEENLEFIAESLGIKANETSRQTIRRYFLKEFYKDHLKTYRTPSSGNRPIYWMFDSGKNDGFKALIYMHRYNESTVAKLRTEYLHSLQRKYEAEILRLQTVAESTTLSVREKTQAKKKIDKINKQIEECKLYDQVVAHVANEKISIDLDDGVKHNYGLFQGIKVPTDSGKEVKMDLLAKI